MLSCFEVFMPQHLGNTFDRNTVGKCDSSGEGMPGDVECQFFVDSTNIGDFFQVRVHFLIAENWQKFILVDYLRVIFIFI